jgi:ribose transport system ATP-binding protein
MSNTHSDVILKITEVSKAFVGVQALDRVSLEVHRGTIHGIVGENGAGKSTLMKILSGVYQKDSGEIILDGITIGNITPIQSMKLGLSIIYQELNLVNTMTVGENVFLGRFSENGGMKGVHVKARILLDSIGCKIDTHKEVSELSVSHKQMIEIAKALSFDSKLIIMDEPSSSLSADEMEQLVRIIHELKAKGISIIYITHRLDEIFGFCDAVSIMRDGHLIDTRNIAAITRNEMISMMVGRTIENEFPPRPNAVGETILEIENINTKLLKNIHFNLKRGEILGIVGLVGAGRTETVRAIFGADNVKNKSIRLEGKAINIISPRSAINLGLALMPEDRKIEGLLLRFSVEKNISVASLDKLSSYGFIREKEEKHIGERQVKALNIRTPSLGTRIQMLSGGNQQKAVLGRWLEMKPKVLILDEPTKGIDVGAKYEIYLLMKKIVEDGGSIILISSELPEVLNMSNRVVTICNGRMTGEFDPTTASAREIMEKAFAFENDKQ